MSIRGNVRSGKFHSGNSPLGKCPFGEMSVWGIVRSGNCPLPHSTLGFKLFFCYKTKKQMHRIYCGLSKITPVLKTAAGKESDDYNRCSLKSSKAKTQKTH